MNSIHDKPIVAFIFVRALASSETSTRFGGFVKRLQSQGNLKDMVVYAVALEDLFFQIIDKDHARVIDIRSGLDLSTISFAYFKSWQVLEDEAAALAHFFNAIGVPFLDRLVAKRGRSKLASQFLLWSKGVPVVPSIYAHSYENALQVFTDETNNVRWPLVVKAVDGSKGENNHLVDSINSLRALFVAHPEALYLVQKFIPNKGDYRIGVYGDVVRFALKRIGAEGTHLNNISQGGRAEYVSPEAVPVAIKDLALRAARSLDMQVSGVDVVEDQETHSLYVLEANLGSQIVTGAFVDKNVAAFNEFLNDTVGSRQLDSGDVGRRLKIIGRRTHVDFPALELYKVRAKVDTGAYGSTLHATNIMVDGDLLRFDYTSPSGLHKTYTVSDFSQVEVRSSNGQMQLRYRISTPIIVEGERMNILISLADRGVMKHTVLLGRRMLRSRFLVNVELSENNIPE